MLSSVLSSERAIAVNIEIMRAFVKLRELLVSNKELARRFDQLEARVDKLIAHDEAIAAILSAIRELMTPAPLPPNGRPIGFTADLEEKS
jgi:predicted component of type VI protein secretion system